MFLRDKSKKQKDRVFHHSIKYLFVISKRFNGNIQWSETGDRYMLKLFRDYIFHQISQNGQPWIDLSHIIQCLNKVNFIKQKVRLGNVKLSISIKLKI